MAGDVDQLPSDKMVSRKLGSDVQQRVIGDTEFSNLQLGFNFRFGEVVALRLGDIFWFRGAGTELESYIAILFVFTAGDDLALRKTQTGNRHVAAIVLQQACHSPFSRAHAITPDIGRHTRSER